MFGLSNLTADVTGAYEVGNQQTETHTSIQSRQARHRREWSY